MLGRSLLLKAGGSALLYPAYVKDYLDRMTAADVAAGDTQGLERPVTDAFSTCLQAMVSDGILGVSGGVLIQGASLIKAGAAMMGARTLSGALVQFAADMPAPTNVNFVPADYNRRTGLGDPANATKRLNSNYTFPGALVDDCSISTFYSSIGTTGMIAAGYTDAGASGSFLAANAARLFNLGTFTFNPNNITSTGFRGISRNSNTSFIYRRAGANETAAVPSFGLTHEVFTVFARTRPNGVFDSFFNGRLAYYAFGRNVNLAALDSRITALANAIQAAITP